MAGVQRNKLDRAIVVTTDFCEEAESNADLIGVIHNGTMGDCLSPTQFIFRHNTGGYTLVFELFPDADVQMVIRTLRGIIPKVRETIMRCNARAEFSDVECDRIGLRLV